jgi:hypothetical protein
MDFQEVNKIFWKFFVEIKGFTSYIYELVFIQLQSIAVLPLRVQGDDVK